MNLQADQNEIIWSEKYRPRTIEECVLPAPLMKQFIDIRDSGALPHLLLSGPAGTGKTTVAKALCEQMGIDVYKINASLDGNIDTLRTEIVRFASSVSLDGGPKAVILDEADYLNPNSTQPALRGVTQEFSSVCSFIFTCNYPNKIIKPIHSRCSVHNFQYEAKEKPTLAKKIFDRLVAILDQENVTYDKKVITKLVMTYFPDFRRMINELQKHSSSGTLDESVLHSFGVIKVSELADHMKQKDFTKMRKWVVANMDNDANNIISTLFNDLEAYLEPDSIPMAVIHLADGQDKMAFAVDQELALTAMMTNLMADCNWK